MKTPGALVAPLLAAVLVVPARGQQILDVLPKGSLAFVGTDDVQALEAAWHASSAGRMHALPEFRDWDKVWNAELGKVLDDSLPGLHLDVDRVLGLLDGPCMAAWLQAAAPATATDSPALAFALIAGVKGHGEEAQDLLDGWVKSLEASGLVSSRATEGETEITTLQPAGGPSVFELRFAIHHELLLVTWTTGGKPTDWLARLFDGIDGKPRDTLSEREDLRASPAGATGPELRAWCDLGSSWRFARSWPAAGSSRLGPALGMMDLLGLSTLGSFSMRGASDEHGSVGSFQVDWPAGTPLRDFWACFLAPTQGTSLLELAPANAIVGFAMQVDWDGLLAAVLHGVQVGGQVPASTVAAGFAEMNKGLGFDLGADLLGRLDGRVAGCLSEVPTGEAFSVPGMPPSRVPVNGLVALGTSDAEGLGALIDAQLHRAGLHVARTSTELLGFTVFHLPVFPGLALDYAVLRDAVVLSTSPTLVQDAVRRAAQPDLPDLATRPDMVKQRARLPAGGCVVESNSAAQMELTARMQAATPAGQPDPSATFTAMFGDNLFTRLLKASMAAAKQMPQLTHEQAEQLFSAPTIATVTVDEKGFRYQTVGP